MALPGDIEHTQKALQGSVRVTQRLTSPGTGAASAPAEARGDMLEDRLDDVGVVVDAELIGHGQQQGIGRGDGFVFLELLDERVRLGGIAPAKNGAGVVAEEADLVVVLVAVPEIGAVAVVDQRKDAAADRHPRLARMTSRLPRLAEDPDLLRLLNVERTSALVILERRALHIHPELARPGRGGIRAGAPPDAIAQARRVRLEAQQARR